MSALVLTADEKTLLDAVDSLVDDAFADGVEYPAATRILAPLPGYGDPRSRPHLSAIRGPFLAALLALSREIGSGGGSPAVVDHLSLLAPIAYSRARWTAFDTTDLSMYFTTGCAFRPSLAVGVLGVDFWWEGGAASVKVSIWSEDGTRQRTVTVSVTGSPFQVQVCRSWSITS